MYVHLPAQCSERIAQKTKKKLKLIAAICADATETVNLKLEFEMASKDMAKRRKIVLSVEGRVKVVGVVFARPLPRDGGMAEDHGAPDTQQLPKAWTRGRKETESRRRASGTESPLLDSAE